LLDKKSAHEHYVFEMNYLKQERAKSSIEREKETQKVKENILNSRDHSEPQNLITTKCKFILCFSVLLPNLALI